MMRKIMKAGPATLTVSLPMPWVKKYGLKKGEELEVIEQGSSLKVKTVRAMEEDCASLDASSTSPISTRLIAALYKAGYKKIKVYYTPNKKVFRRGKEMNELDMIKNTFDHLDGMQLWELGREKNKNYALIVESAKLNSEQFKSVLSKLLINVVNQAENVSLEITEKESFLEESYINERLINQTADFCTKVLCSFGYEDHKKTIYFKEYISQLEKIGDSFFDISLEHHKNKRQIDKDTIKVMASIKEFLKTSEWLYRKFSLENTIILAKEIKETKKDYQNKIAANKIHGLISYHAYTLLTELIDLTEILCLLNYDYFKDNSAQ